ncbi:MAG: B12-binding domain-containing radical SAM protein, partial [Fibrobacterota bacterium]
MKIITLNPPFFKRFSRESRSPAVAKSGTLYYPMWLAYATGVLEKAGHEVSLIDAPAAGHDTAETVRLISSASPGLIIMNTSTPSIDNDLKVAEEIKKSSPDSVLCMVGTHVSALPEETVMRSDAVDLAAFGEYDYTVRDLAARISEGTPWKDLKGICYRENEKAVKNPPADPVTDLDELPFVSEVYKKHLDISDYFYGHSRHPIMVFVTGRGCPHRCTYCVMPQTMHGHAYRTRSEENVAEEFKYVCDNFPEVKEIMIEDDTFTINKKRAARIAELIIQKKADRIPWSANSRADVDLETMKTLHKANCRLFCVGFESGSQEILDNIKKKTELNR